MADYGISTLGVTFGYGVETTAGTKPASFTKLTRINEIGEITVDPEEIDASALEDYETHYVPGRATVSEQVAITVNRTDATVTEWETLIAAYEDNGIVTLGKSNHSRNAVANLPADSVIISKRSRRLDMAANICHNLLELFQRLCSL